MQNNSSKIIERRRHFGGVAWVSDPPKLISRGRNWAKRSATKVSEAAYPRRLHYVPPQRTPPRRRNRPNARASSKSNRHYCSVAMVIFPAELTTDEERTYPGRKTCTKRQFGIVAQVTLLAEVSMQAEKIPTTEDKLDRAPPRQRGLG